MLFYLFLFTALMQLILYNSLDKKYAGNGKWAVLAVLLAIYCLILPCIFTFSQSPPKAGERGNECGLSALVIFVFPLFGGGLTILTHLAYWIFKKIDKMTD